MTINRYAAPREPADQVERPSGWLELFLIRAELGVALSCAAWAPISYLLLVESTNGRVARNATVPAIFFVLAGAFIGGAGLVQRRQERWRWLGQLLAVGGGLLLTRTARMFFSLLTL
jgi:hypothetical protein